MTKRFQANFSFYKHLCILIIPVVAIYLYTPVKSAIIDNELVPLLPIEFIFVDQSTRHGYLIATFIVMGFAIFGVSVIVFVGLTFDIVILDYAPRVDIVEIDFNELDMLWCDTSTSSIAYRRMALRNICQKFDDLRGYVRVACKEFYD